MEGEKRGEQDEALLSFVALVRIGDNEVLLARYRRQILQLKRDLQCPKRAKWIELSKQLASGSSWAETLDSFLPSAMRWTRSHSVTFVLPFKSSNYCLLLSSFCFVSFPIAAAIVFEFSLPSPT